jgi:hypothetical protein
MGLVCALGLSLLVVATTSAVGFSPYNANWDGTGEFRELAESRGELTVATDVDQYKRLDPAATTAFVFAPDREYATADGETVREFVEGGGTLVVADNYGSAGNALLAEVGATARFDGRILRDEANNFRSPSLPTVTDISSHQLVDGVETLTLNYGTAVEPGAATPLANSSELSYLAVNDTMTSVQSSNLQQYPVATVEPVGEGQVIVIGDPSLFINSMIDESDNRRFATTLLDQRTRSVFDQSHSAGLPPVVTAILGLQSSPPLAAGLIAVLVGLIAIIGRRESLRSQQWIDSVRLRIPIGTRSAAVTVDSPNADPEALKAQLRDRHPEWDDDRLDRVITGVLSQHTDSSDNE